MFFHSEPQMEQFFTSFPPSLFPLVSKANNSDLLPVRMASAPVLETSTVTPGSDGEWR